MNNYRGYFLKTLGLKEDQIPGGIGDETKSIEVDPAELKTGIDVEMEHTHDATLAKEIALDHLSEDPQYYSRLKKAGLEDGGDTPIVQKLFSPTAIMPTPVIAVGVRGTKTGLLPAGGIVADPEKARLGGLELVKNLKPNSQGAIANTPAPKTITADGGHFTPDNNQITKGKSPETSVKGDDSIHPMQVQQLGNKPFEDDGTTRDGETTPPAAGGDSDTPCPKGPWGIEMDPEVEDEEEEEEGEDVSIDIKETFDSSTKDRFQKLANIQKTDEAGALSEKVNPKEMEKSLQNLNKKNPAAYAQLIGLPFGFIPSYVWEDPNNEWWSSDEAREKLRQVRDAAQDGPKPGGPTKVAPGAKYSWQTTVDDIQEVVNRLKSKGKTSPLLEKAEKFLKKYNK